MFVREQLCPILSVKGNHISFTCFCAWNEHVKRSTSCHYWIGRCDNNCNGSCFIYLLNWSSLLKTWCCRATSTIWYHRMRVYKETFWMSKNDLRIDKPLKGICTDANHLHLQMCSQKRGWNYWVNGFPQLPALCLNMLDLWV